MKHKKLMMGCLLCACLLVGLAVNPGYALHAAFNPAASDAALNKAQADNRPLSSEQVWTGIINRLIEKVVKVDENLEISQVLRTDYGREKSIEALIFTSRNYILSIGKDVEKFTLGVSKLNPPLANATWVREIKYESPSLDLYRQCDSLWVNAMRLYNERQTRKEYLQQQEELRQFDQAFR